MLWPNWEGLLRRWSPPLQGKLVIMVIGYIQILVANHPFCAVYSFRFIFYFLKLLMTNYIYSFLQPLGNWPVSCDQRGQREKLKLTKE